ncbi:MAG: DUF1638 domain-containing protein [Gammaproteobacteria bacterium]|nr:DUF1638 domain-containing protein [Gammaproteobacteria bacterium]
MTASVLIITCGAIAREIVELLKINDWNHIKIQSLSAELHNRPEKIPAAVAEIIKAQQGFFEQIFVAYADCGTGGLLDKTLQEFDIKRLPGAHCYDFFSGQDVINEISNAEPGSFYLTDFLTRHFDRLIKKGLGLDKHPELMETYFGNYHQLVYLSQSKSAELELMAQQQAKYLGLEYKHHTTGLGNLEKEIRENIVL